MRIRIPLLIDMIELLRKTYLAEVELERQLEQLSSDLKSLIDGLEHQPVAEQFSDTLRDRNILGTDPSVLEVA